MAAVRHEPRGEPAGRRPSAPLLEYLQETQSVAREGLQRAAFDRLTAGSQTPYVPSLRLAERTLVLQQQLARIVGQRHLVLAPRRSWCRRRVVAAPSPESCSRSAMHPPRLLAIWWLRRATSSSERSPRTSSCASRSRATSSLAHRESRGAAAAALAGRSFAARPRRRGAARPRGRRPLREACLTGAALRRDVALRAAFAGRASPAGRSFVAARPSRARPRPGLAGARLPRAQPSAGAAFAGTLAEPPAGAVWRSLRPGGTSRAQPGGS